MIPYSCFPSLKLIGEALRAPKASKMSKLDRKTAIMKKGAAVTLQNKEYAREIRGDRDAFVMV